MHRLSPALVAALALTTALAGMSWASRAAASAPAPGMDGTAQQTSLEVFMSDAADGPRRHSFASTTGSVFAVVAHTNAAGERYRIRIRDLSGITVKVHDTDALRGDGRATVSVGAADFVASYKGAVATAGTLLRENGTKLTAKCASIPSGSEFEEWRKDMLSTVESSRTATTEVTKTLQAVLVMPDAGAIEGIQAAVGQSSATLGEGHAKLGDAKLKLQPATGRPDAPAACTLLGEANAKTIAGLDQGDSALALLPADTSGWRLPKTQAIYNGTQFRFCTQYTTDIAAIKNNQAGDTAASSSWSVGDAGPPALMFQSPRDVGEAGKLRLSYDGDADAMYAQTVTVPGVNRSASVTAFVTDAQCIPVDGVDVTLSVEPSTAGSVTPARVTASDGVVQATVASGNEAALAKVNAVVCVGPCGEGGNDVKGSASFDVIGTTKNPDLKIIPHTRLNPLSSVVAYRKGMISAFPKDAFSRSVAPGTTMVVRIQSGPGELAYNRTRIVNGRPVGDEQVIVLGKKADLLVMDNGTTRIPPGEPGYSYGNLYLQKGSDGEGKLVLSAEADGVSQTLEYEIASRMSIYLPIAAKSYDIRIPLPTPTRRPPLPTETPGAQSR